MAREYLKQRMAPRIAVCSSEPIASMEGRLLQGPIDEIHVLDAASHWLHQQRNEDFNRLMLGWLNRARPFGKIHG